MDQIWKKLAQASWPSEKIIQCEGLSVRDNNGRGGSRANSVESLHNGHELDPNLTRYIIWPNDQQLAHDLRLMGYKDNDHATVFKLDNLNASANDMCKVAKKIDDNLVQFFIHNNVDQSRVDIMHRSQLDKAFVTFECDNEIFGAVYSAYEDGKAWMYSLVVSEKKRRNGIARKIMQTTIYTLRMNGVHEVALSVLPSNHAAIKLYTSLGFKEVSQYYFLERSDV